MGQQTRMNPTGNSIVLPEILVKQALERAQNLGIDLSSYIQTLIKDDLSAPIPHAWLEPLPAALSQQYAADVQDFLAFEIDSPQQGASSGQELADLLDQDCMSQSNG